MQSRSLDNGDSGYYPPQAVNTVVEAGRGVRKLPVPVVRNNGVNNGPTPYEQMLLDTAHVGPATDPLGPQIRPTGPPQPQPPQSESAFYPPGPSTEPANAMVGPLPNWT